MEEGVHANIDVPSPAVYARCCAVKRLDVLGEKDDVVRELGDSMPLTGLQKRCEAGVELLQNEHRASATSESPTRRSERERPKNELVGSGSLLVMSPIRRREIWK